MVPHPGVYEQCKLDLVGYKKKKKKKRGMKLGGGGCWEVELRRVRGRGGDECHQNTLYAGMK